MKNIQLLKIHLVKITENTEILEFSFKEHLKLIQFSKNRNKICYICLGKNSTDQFIKIQKQLDYIKIPSACNLDFELLNVVVEKFKKKIHISLGMSKKNEIEKILNFFLKKRKDQKIL